MTSNQPPVWPTDSPIPVHRLPHHVWNRRQQLGTAVRLVKGLYVLASDWDKLSPWHRHRVLVEAWHQWNPKLTFTGHTALALRGLPVLMNPWEVHAATEPPARRSLHKVVRGGRAVATHVLVRTAVVAGAPTWDQRGDWSCDDACFAAAVVAGAPNTQLGEAVVVLDGVWRSLGGTERAQRRLVGAIEALPHPAHRRRALAALAASSPLAESAAESLARVAIADLGFAAPREQYTLAIDGREYRPDFAWPAQRLILEVDGGLKYAGGNEAEVRRFEKERHQALTRAGFTVGRAEWADVVQPGRLRRILNSLGVPPR